MSDVQHFIHHPTLATPDHLDDDELAAINADADAIATDNAARLRHLAVRGAPIQIDAAQLATTALIEILMAAGIPISHAEVSRRSQQLTAEAIGAIEEQIDALILTAASGLVVPR